MLEKIKAILKGARSLRNYRGCQSTRGYKQSRMPPVIDFGSQRHPNLADDLSPHVERFIGILPRCKRQTRPGSIGERAMDSICHDGSLRMGKSDKGKYQMDTAALTSVCSFLSRSDILERQVRQHAIRCLPIR